MKIRTRIILGFALIVALSFFFLLRQFAGEVERQYLQAIEEPMVDTAHLLASILESELLEGGLDTRVFERGLRTVGDRRFESKIYDLLKTSVTMRVYVADRNGLVVFDSDTPGAVGEDYSSFNDVFRTLRGEYGARSTRTDAADETSSIMYVGAPVRFDGHIIGVVSIGKPQRSVAQFIFDTRNAIRLAGLATALCAILAGIAFSAWLTRPIVRLTEYARAVKRGERATLPRLGHSEIGTLGEAFEEMRDALEGRKYVENYVQTLTHELKSPLAAIRGASELLEEDMPAGRRASFLHNIRTETVRLQNITDRLLQLAALESRKQLEEAQPVDLAALAREVCASLEPLAASRDIHIELRCDSEVAVRGELFLLETAIANLVQNAIDFSPRGAPVTVSVSRRDGTPSITVDDQGPGVPDYARERIFERFYSLQRPDTGKKSSGLGLCLVREIAQLHGGDVSLVNAGAHGTRATLTLAG